MFYLFDDPAPLIAGRRAGKSALLHQFVQQNRIKHGFTHIAGVGRKLPTDCGEKEIDVTSSTISQNKKQKTPKNKREIDPKLMQACTIAGRLSMLRSYGEDDNYKLGSAKVEHSKRSLKRDVRAVLHGASAESLHKGWVARKVAAKQVDYLNHTMRHWASVPADNRKPFFDFRQAVLEAQDDFYCVPAGTSAGIIHGYRGLKSGRSGLLTLQEINRLRNASVPVGNLRATGAGQGTAGAPSSSEDPDQQTQFSEDSLNQHMQAVRSLCQAIHEETNPIPSGPNYSRPYWNARGLMEVADKIKATVSADRDVTKDGEKQKQEKLLHLISHLVCAGYEQAAMAGLDARSLFSLTLKAETEVKQKLNQLRANRALRHMTF